MPRKCCTQREQEGFAVLKNQPMRKCWILEEVMVRKGLMPSIKEVKGKITSKTRRRNGHA